MNNQPTPKKVISSFKVILGGKILENPFRDNMMKKKMGNILIQKKNQQMLNVGEIEITLHWREVIIRAICVGVFCIYKNPCP